MKAPPRLKFIVALVAAGLTLHALVSAAPVAPPARVRVSTSQYVPHELLVKFKSASGTEERKAIIAVRGHSLLENLNLPGWARVKIGAGQTMATALNAFRNDSGVEYVQPNFLYHALKVPKDTQYDQLWALKNTGQTVTEDGTYGSTTGTTGDDMNIEPAWDHITDCSSVVVAVIDTGVNYKQEDLADNMWDGGQSYPKHGYNFVDNDPDPKDLDGHGSHVAGIIGAAGNNGKGTTGVCWKASIMAVRVLDATGSGMTATIASAIKFAVDHDAKVINMSLGGSGPEDEAFEESISYAQDHDVVVVVAAGNESSSNEAAAVYPCNFTQPNLICVAALDQNYKLAGFSNWGAISVDVGAPGTNILSTFAGTVASTPDSLTDWEVSRGWAHYLGANGKNILSDPANFPESNYGLNLNDTATKEFPIPSADAVILNFRAAINLDNAQDRFIAGVGPNGIDPSGDDAERALIKGPVHDGTNYNWHSLDLIHCMGQSSCMIGFELETGTTGPGAMGIAIASFSIDALTLTTDTYQIENGTSMAAPEVAGLATMLRAYNPQYTFADTVSAIEDGGRSIAALADKTTSGKAVDVMSSLAFIHAPTGLTAAVQ